MLAAVGGLAYTLSTLLKLQAYLGYLLPLPVVVAAMRGGAAAGRRTMSATAFLLLGARSHAPHHHIRTSVLGTLGLAYLLPAKVPASLGVHRRRRWPPHHVRHSLPAPGCKPSGKTTASPHSHSRCTTSATPMLVTVCKSQGGAGMGLLSGARISPVTCKGPAKSSRALRRIISAATALFLECRDCSLVTTSQHITHWPHKVCLIVP